MNDEEQKAIVDNEAFMTWLTQKLNEEYIIGDHDMSFDKDDLIMAKNIRKLYKLIFEYANIHNIQAIDGKYCVNYQDNIFLIGKDEKEKNYLCCMADMLDKNEMQSSVIDFNELSNVNNPELDMLVKLKEDIIKLHESGVSVDAIEMMLQPVFGSLEKEEELNKKKKLVKRRKYEKK